MKFLKQATCIRYILAKLSKSVQISTLTSSDSFWQSRVYFKKVKHPGTGCFIRKCLFWKKKLFFLIWIKSVKNNFQFGGCHLHLPFWIIQVSFCETNMPFYWSEEPFSKNNLIQFFILNRQFLNLSYFWKNLIIYFAHVFYGLWGIMKYMVWNLNVDCENKKLNRNAHNVLRRSLFWHNW